MALKGMKRPATASGGSRAKKVRTNSVVSRSNVIASELGAARDVLNPHLAKLLSGVAPIALRTPKEERHKFQAELVEMTGAALRMIEESLRKHVNELQKGSDGADGEKQARIAAREEAEKSLGPLRDATAESKRAVREDSAVVVTAKSELNKALSAQKTGDKAFDEAEAKRIGIESAVAESLGPLKESGLQGSQGKASLKRVQKMTKECGIEDSLLKAFPRVLALLPTDRSTFDNVMVKQLEEEIAASVASITKTLDELRPGKEERAAAVEAAKSAHDAAAGKCDASKGTQKEAQAAVRAGHRTLKEAERKLVSFFPDMKKLMDKLDEAKERLAVLREGPLAHYDELKDLAKDAGVAEEAPEEAPEAPEPAAADAA